MVQPIVLLMLLAMQLVSFVSSETVYITPELDASECPINEPCFTLSQFARNTSIISSQPTVILMFLPGHHNLSEPLSIRNITALELLSSSNLTGMVTITCSGTTNFVFENIEQFRIRGLSFNGCGNRVIVVQKFLVEKSSFDGRRASGSALHMEEVSEAKISECSFTSNIKVGSNSDRHLLFLNSGCVKIDILLDHIGGAMTVFNSAVLINSSHFDLNIARIGGAMYSANSNITITGCNFSSNVANHDSKDIITDEESTGGAIHSVGSNIVIEGSAFNNNTATGNGGVIFNDGNLTITNGSSFAGNTAHVDGGAVYNHRGTVTIDTKNTFTHNIAYRVGGAICNHQLLTVTSSNTFEGNSASSNGGALYNSGTLLVTNSNHFIASTTIGNGGALFNVGELTITNNNVFESNTAQRNGGGVYNAERSVNISDSNEFINNLAMIDGGALWTQFGSIMIQDNVTFVNNTALGDGGALWVRNAVLIIRNGNLFHGNHATMDGGVIWIQYSSLIITTHNEFSSNIAVIDGGAILAQFSNFTVTNNNVFDSNIAYDDGGAVFARENTLTEFLNGNSFINNSAGEDGGALYLRRLDDMIFSDNEFVNNRAAEQGGAMRFYKSTVTFSNNNVFSNNKAIDGAAIFSRGSILTSEGLVNITENTAECAGVVYIEYYSRMIFYGHTEMRSNIGSLFLNYNSTAKFFGNASFTNSSPNSNAQCSRTEVSGQAGGITLNIGGEITFYETVYFVNNKADTGGAILARSNSSIRVQGNVNIKQNEAQSYGAGIYIFESRLIIGDYIRFDGNMANKSGGGVYSLKSNITILNGSLHLSENQAEFGGGVYLDWESRLLISEQLPTNETNEMNTTDKQSQQLRFTDNSAIFGGAIYVDDQDNPAACASSALMNQSLDTGCFFQISLQDYSKLYTTINESCTYFYFSNNSAQRGAAIYGGLLDRCVLQPPGEFPQNEMFIHPVDYLQKMSNLKESDVKSQISSEAVRVCFCRDEIPDCTYQLPPVTVKLDGMFTVSAAAVDQVNNTLSATVYSSLLSLEEELIRTLLSRNTSQKCTQLDFNIASPRSSETLILYADGPCSNIGISQRMIELEFQTCESYCARFIGFQPSQSNRTTCQCECRIDLPYFTNCMSSTGELVRDGDYWVNVINETNKTAYSFFSVHFCPYDYCLPSTEHVYINLTRPNGSDAQCAFNRSGKACGSCKEGLSLVFGSSRCKECSNYYLALLIPFAIAGILIVVFLIACNLTVAVGTMNGVIFYANIVVANRVIFFPFGVTSALTVFISWLSLSVGFETCFYDGMDSYAKVLLQFLFDLYLISFVIVIMVACHYSQRLSNFLADKNPVATLATLILYTYEKSTRKLFSLLAFAVVRYSNGYVETVWLFDPNERYLHGRHTAFFILFFFIFLFGCVFNFLLLFGHCLTRLPNRRLFKLVHHPKFLSFLDAYQAPYKPYHRYWVGLLLFVREVLYLFLEFNAAGDNRISLLVVISIGVGVLSFKLFVGGIYKTRFLDILETFFILNLTMFAVITFYDREVNFNQTIIAHLSFTIVLITFLGILTFHTYKYVLKGTVVQEYIDKYLEQMKEAFLDRCTCFSAVKGNETEQRNYDSSMQSFTNTLQRPLHLLNRNPTTNEYRMAEYPNGMNIKAGCVTSAVVEITRNTPPLSRMLGHDRTVTLIDSDSAQSPQDDDSEIAVETESTINTQTTVSTNLSSEDTS